ncbi:MAG: hypothetical protein WC087_02995 [Candidatus Paceibacterota bacterium]
MQSARDFLNEMSKEFKTDSFQWHFLGELRDAINEEAILSERQQFFVYTKVTSIFSKPVTVKGDVDADIESYEMTLSLATYINSCR